MKKSVRFSDETDNTVICLPPAETEEHADETSHRSISPAELQENRDQRKVDVEHCKRNSYGVLLSDSFQDPVVHVQQQLNVLVQLSDSCARGLERQISKKHDHERKELRYQCIQNVLAEYSRLSYRRRSAEVIWSELAKVSKLSSRQAIRFARRLGKADEAWVKEGDIEDMNFVRRTINDIKARQLKKDLKTSYWQNNKSKSSSRLSGTAKLGSSLHTLLDESRPAKPLIMKTHESKFKSRLTKSASDRFLDSSSSSMRSLSNFDLKTKKKSSYTNHTKSDPKTNKSNSRKSLLNQQPSSRRSKLMSMTGWNSSPALNYQQDTTTSKRTTAKASRTDSNGDLVDKTLPERRTLMQRWNSLSVLGGNEPQQESQSQAASPFRRMVKCSSVSDLCRQDTVPHFGRRSSLSFFHGKEREEVLRTATEITAADEDLSDSFSSPDLNDSIVIHRVRPRQSTIGQSSVSTLRSVQEDADQASSMDESSRSLWLDDLDNCEDNESINDDDKLDGSDVKINAAAPKAKQVRKWSSSLSALDALPESTAFTPLYEITNTKKVQLAKAEEWVARRSKASSELSRDSFKTRVEASDIRVGLEAPPTTNHTISTRRTASLVKVKSTSAMLTSSERETIGSSCGKRGKFRSFLKRLGSVSKLSNTDDNNEVQSEPVVTGRSDTTASLPISKSNKVDMNPRTGERLGMRRARMLTRHCSTSALSSKLDRVPSNSTLKTVPEELDDDILEAVEPKQITLKQSLMWGLKVRAK